LEVVKKITRRFYGISSYLTRFFPSLFLELKQARLDFRPREYIAIALFCFIFYFSIIFFLLFFLGLIVYKTLPAMLSTSYFYISLAIALVFSGFVFYYLITYPKLLTLRKIKSLEKDLLFALRHLLVQIRSGVPLFNSLVSVSTADYGLISDEFKIAVKEIHGGVPEVEALDNMAFRNPSLHFRRVIWQIVNAMRAGSDIGETLKEIVNNLANEQRIEIRRYGAQLNPMALIYMMSAVIIPSLGITFLIVLSSFIGFTILPLDFALYGILAFLVFFQFMFMGLVKTRRPPLVI